jgi:cephalosporin hydroxylase
MKMLDDVHDVDSAIDMAWRYKGTSFYRSIRPNQDRDEFTTAARLVQDLQPKVIVELGTRHGGSLFGWCQTSKDLEVVISVDLPGGIHGGGYVEQRTKLYSLFAANHPACTLTLLRADSQIDETRDEVARLIGDRPIDMLFIDADHRYEGVKRDYELYSPLVRDGGLIAFHDIRPNTQDAATQVFRFWDELKADGLDCREIVDEPYRGWFGIGVVTHEAARASSGA